MWEFSPIESTRCARFTANAVRLPYEELLPVGGGVRQYRYGLLGSVLKINHSRDPLAPRIAGGYKMLSISDPRTPMPLAMQDPDGNDIELVPAGQRGVNQIEIHIGVTDESAFEKFLWRRDACGADGAGRFKLGNTILSFRHDPAAVRAIEDGSPTRWRRCAHSGCATSQSRCATATASIAASSRWACGKAPRRCRSARSRAFRLIRDPDGNFIEISQRASLTGPIPD